MGKRLKLVTSSARQTGGDPLRAALSDALAGEKKAKAKLAAHHAAIKRADEQVTASERKLEELQAESAAAKSAYAGELAQAVAAAASTIPGTPKALREAEVKVGDAEKTLEAVRVARDRLKGDLRGVEIDAHLSEMDVAAAVDAALAPSVEKLLALGEANRVTMYQCVAALSELRSGAGRDPYFNWSESEWRERSDANKRRAAMLPLRDEIERLGMRVHYKDQNTGVDEVITAWRAAVARMRVDPQGAALPPLPGDA
jgi:hypothetical protein